MSPFSSHWLLDPPLSIYTGSDFSSLENTLFCLNSAPALPYSSETCPCLLLRPFPSTFTPSLNPPVWLFPSQAPHMASSQVSMMSQICHTGLHGSILAVCVNMENTWKSQSCLPKGTTVSSVLCILVLSLRLDLNTCYKHIHLFVDFT